MGQPSIFENSYLIFSVNKKDIDNYNSLNDNEKIKFLKNSQKRDCYDCNLSTEGKDLCNLCNTLCEIDSKIINNEIDLINSQN